MCHSIEQCSCQKIMLKISQSGEQKYPVEWRMKLTLSRMIGSGPNSIELLKQNILLNKFLLSRNNQDTSQK